MMTTFPTKERRAGMVKSDRHQWTYDDLRNQPETLDRYEIIDGVLYLSPSPHVRRHQLTLQALNRLLDGWVVSHDLGTILSSPADIVLAPNKVLQPDLFFVRKENLSDIDAFVACTPDLVVEVISPATAHYDRDTKFRAYEESGVRECWIVDPQERSLEIYALEAGKFQLHGRFGADETAASRLLEGLAFDVRTIFE